MFAGNHTNVHQLPDIFRETVYRSLLFEVRINSQEAVIKRTICGLFMSIQHIKLSEDKTRRRTSFYLQLNCLHIVRNKCKLCFLSLKINDLNKTYKCC